MGWFGKSRAGAWDLARVKPPWGEGRSIYEHVAAHIAPGVPGLLEGGSRLPDEKDDGGIKWVAGGLDGAFGHHGSPGSNQTRAKLLQRALKVVLEDASHAKLSKLYEQLLQDGAVEFIDPLLRLLVEQQDLGPTRLGELALWIAEHAPDREPVKIAIALLGMLSGVDRSDLFLTLGRHEEFTLYAAVALANSAGSDAERLLFELARQVDGWGRIQIVERLAETKDPEIRSWMLREGYKNAVMYEYTAFTCAVAGGLRQVLERPVVDLEVLAGAGDIIRALLFGGPAEDMDDYADGAVVVGRYLHHVGEHATSLDELMVLDAIQSWLENDAADWHARADRGWSAELRRELRSRVVGLKALPHWREWIQAGLEAEDSQAFAQAAEAARAVGIDTWEHRFARLAERDEDHWYHLMQTQDGSRVDRVVALAEARLPLDAIASGPGTELGFGTAWNSHGQLDFVLQDLGRFPGKGWALIRCGLMSPVTRNRNMALRALSPWGIEKWPSDAESVLRAVLKEEPEEGVRARIQSVLAGGSIDEEG